MANQGDGTMLSSMNFFHAGMRDMREGIGMKEVMTEDIDWIFFFIFHIGFEWI